MAKDTFSNRALRLVNSVLEARGHERLRGSSAGKKSGQRMFRIPEGIRGGAEEAERVACAVQALARIQGCAVGWTRDYCAREVRVTIRPETSVRGTSAVTKAGDALRLHGRTDYSALKDWAADTNADPQIFGCQGLRRDAARDLRESCGLPATRYSA